MACLSLHSTTLSSASPSKTHKLLLPLPRINIFLFQHKPSIKKPQSLQSFRTFFHLGCPKITVTPASCDGFIGKTIKEESFSLSEIKPVKLLFWILIWAFASLGFHALCGDARAAAADSIRGSGFGVKVANALRASGWPDEAVVFSLAMLPVIELRGAIPVGYWMQLHPFLLTLLSVLGNMVPVPFIILYLKKVASFLTGKNEAASRFLAMLHQRAKKHAGVVKEFEWLGLMLFVAVPLPGTGAWTGAFIASILEMPLWVGLSANFVGVVLAALLVNLLVNLGLQYALICGVIMFVVSTFMWRILRGLKKSLAASDNVGSV